MTIGCSLPGSKVWSTNPAEYPLDIAQVPTELRVPEEISSSTYVTHFPPKHPKTIVSRIGAQRRLGNPVPLFRKLLTHRF